MPFCICLTNLAPLVEGILHRGDGSNIYLREQPWKAITILGDGKQRRVECEGCDSSAMTNRLLAPVALASGRDGSLYVGDYNFIRKVSASREEVTNVLQLRLAAVNPIAFNIIILLVLL